MERDLDPKASRAAALILAAWRDPDAAVPNLPEELRPRDLAEVTAIQHAVSDGLGQIGGWKVGAAGPEAVPTCAPMPLDGLHESPAHLPASRWRMRGVEAEICFRLGRDLPPYDAPFTRAQVLAAIDTCHPAIEVLESRFTDLEGLDPLTRLADGLSHGCFVYGAPIAGWQDIDFAAERVRVLFGETEDVARVGPPSPDMIRLIEWLANAGTHWAGGLHAGDIITTGSWTGKSLAPLGTGVRVLFANAGSVEVEFA